MAIACFCKARTTHAYCILNDLIIMSIGLDTTTLQDDSIHSIQFRDLALNGEIHGTKYLRNLEFWILVNKDLHYHRKTCKNLTKN